MDFAAVWNKAAKAEKKQFGGDDLPEGTYIVEVMKCTLGPTKAGDKDMVSWDLKVIEGEQKNNHIFINRAFSKVDESEQNIKAIQRALNDFIDLGLNAEAPVLKKTIREVVGKNIEIKLVAGEKGQFQNFKRIVEVIPTFTGEIADEEEIPF